VSDLFPVVKGTSRPENFQIRMARGALAVNTGSSPDVEFELL